MPVRQASRFFASLETLRFTQAAPPSAPPETSVVKYRHGSSTDSPSLPRSINKNPVAAILLLQRPRDPEFSASILRSPFSRLESRLLLRFTEAIFQRPHGKVRLLLINQEGRRQANGVFTCTEHQQAFMKSQIDDRVAQIRGLFLRPLIAHDLNADHQAASSYIADDFEVLGPISQSPEEVIARAAGGFHELALDPVRGGQR